MEEGYLFSETVRTRDTRLLTSLVLPKVRQMLKQMKKTTYWCKADLLTGF